MDSAVVAMLTRGSIVPGVHAGSGNPPWLTQPVALVRGASTQAVATTVGTGTAAVSTGATVGTSVEAGAAVATLTSVGMAVTSGNRGSLRRGRRSRWSSCARARSQNQR